MDTFGENVGSETEHGRKSVAIVCPSCGYAEWYVESEIFGQIAAVGWESYAEARGIRAERSEQVKQVEGKRGKRVLPAKVVWSVLAAFVIVIASVIFYFVRLAPGTPGNLLVGQAVTDHGLFIQVRSLALYKEESGRDDIVVGIKLQNQGNEDITVVFGDEADGDNVLLVGTKFPGTNNPGFPLTPSALPASYQNQHMQQVDILRPGATMEGLVFYPYVQDGQKATAISFWHSLSQSPFNYYDWPIPQTGVKYLQGS